jgi:AAA+ superfamily predicted ATPase
MQFILGNTQDPLDFTVYLHPSKLASLNTQPGSIVRLISRTKQSIFARTSESPVPVSSILTSRAIRSNLSSFLGQVILVVVADPVPCSSISFAAIDDTVGLLNGDLVHLLTSCPSYDFSRFPIQSGTILPVFALHRVLEFIVQSCEPSGPVVITATTKISLSGRSVPRPKTSKPFDVIGYDSIGGLDSEIADLRSELEWPLTQPHLFDSFGLRSHRSILLNGARGCGKSLLVHALRSETPFHFEYVRGLDTIAIPPAKATELLKKCVDRALSKPSIVCFDDIDQIAEEQEWPTGRDRRLPVALLGAIDRLIAPRGALAVIATTSRELPPEVRSRFTKAITLSRPTGDDRIDIVRVMLRGVMGLRDPEQITATLKGITGAEMKLEIERTLMDKAFQLLQNLTDRQAVGVSIAEAQAVNLDSFVGQSWERKSKGKSMKRTTAAQMGKRSKSAMVLVRKIK